MSAELTYGLERIAMYLQGVESVYDLVWAREADGGVIRYADVHYQTEVEFSHYNFEEADVTIHFDIFDKYEAEGLRLVEKGLTFPAYDHALKCSHTFNLLDARGAISVSERARYIGRIRKMARACAESYLKSRYAAGFSLIKDEAQRREHIALYAAQYDSIEAKPSAGKG